MEEEKKSIDVAAIAGNADKIVDSKLGTYISLGIAVVALIVAIVALVFSLCCKEDKYDFSDDAEDAAIALYARGVKAKIGGTDQDSYFWDKFADEAISNAEVEVCYNKEDADDAKYAIAFVQSKVNGKTQVEVYHLEKNEDDVWVSTDNVGNLRKASDEKWVKEMDAKVADFEKKNEKIKTANVK